MQSTFSYCSINHIDSSKWCESLSICRPCTLHPLYHSPKVGGKACAHGLNACISSSKFVVVFKNVSKLACITLSKWRSCTATNTTSLTRGDFIKDNAHLLTSFTMEDFISIHITAARLFSITYILYKIL